ncbi:uncharacterized protein LOC134738304 [Pongo pygmaeus]|uniref:uncharacterized protein LOC134738304 n=1 Tax=Pongo pygmaeus TaxID=9600 RepID=UPI00300CEEB4
MMPLGHLALVLRCWEREGARRLSGSCCLHTESDCSFGAQAAGNGLGGLWNACAPGLRTPRVVPPAPLLGASLRLRRRWVFARAELRSPQHRPGEHREGGAEFSAQTSEIQRRRSGVLLSTDPGGRAWGTARAELLSAQHRPGEHREDGAEFSAQTSEIQRRRSSVLLSTDLGGRAWGTARAELLSAQHRPWGHCLALGQLGAASTKNPNMSSEADTKHIKN